MKIIDLSFKNEIVEYIKGNREKENFVNKLENELIKNGVVDKEKKEISEFVMDILDYLKKNFENDWLRDKWLTLFK